MAFHSPKSEEDTVTDITIRQSKGYIYGRKTVVRRAFAL